MIRHNRFNALLGIMLAAWLAACNTEPQAGPPTAQPTETPLLLSGIRVSTLTPAPSATHPPATDIPSAPATAPILPTATPGCIIGAAFVADVTIPDGSVVAPNAQFVKTWRVQNSGTCDWGTGITVVRAEGEALGGSASVALPNTAVGGTRDVSITFTAPGNPGTYEAKYRVRTASGVGLTALTVSIVVQATPTPAGPPTATPKPSPIPTYSGTLDSFPGMWIVVPDKFGGNVTDTQRLQQVQIRGSGATLYASPATVYGSPYAFAFFGEVPSSYSGGNAMQWEFDDAARGHVTMRMTIRKACNANLRLTYPGFQGTFIVQNERSLIPCT